MRTPKFWYQDKSVYKIFLFPFTFLWLLGYFLNKKRKKIYSFNIPIICVGNIIAGGAGKTPIVIKLAEIFKKKGHTVHIIKKQYKNSSKKKIIKVSNNSPPNIVGDEPLLTAKVTHTWVVKVRSKGIQAAIKKGATLIILDDGYQDYSVKKDLNILTVNQNQNFGNENIIPAGPLREKIRKGINRADFIFFYGTKNNLNPYLSESNKPIAYVKIEADKAAVEKIKNKNILAFCGIAHPENFFGLLRYYNFNLIRKFIYPDHYFYSKHDLIKMISESEKKNLSLVTTEKDYVKVNKNFRNKIFSIPLKIKFNENKFYNFFLKKISADV